MPSGPPNPVMSEALIVAPVVVYSPTVPVSTFVTNIVSGNNELHASVDSRAINGNGHLILRAPNTNIRCIGAFSPPSVNEYIEIHASLWPHVTAILSNHLDDERSLTRGKF